MNWSVVTVTYNSRAHLERHWKRRDRGFRWIIVDNGSTDGTIDLAEELADLVIHSTENVGFSRANNRGLEEVTSKYVAFVNPDVSLPPVSNWGERISTIIDRTGAIVGPQLLNEDGSEQANARGIPYLSAKIRNRLRPESRGGDDYAQTGLSTPTYCAWLMGAAVCGSTATFRSLCGWDESYFLYYEDHELGMRAWREAVPVILDPEVKWVHEWQRATSKPDAAAWRREVQAMRVFFKAFPWLLVPKGAPGSSARLRKHGYGELMNNLWREAPLARLTPPQSVVDGDA